MKPLLDTIFPSLCVICETVSSNGLCPQCSHSLPTAQIPFSCYPCGKSFFGVHSCLSMSPLDAFMPVLPYQRRRVKHSIHMYKYYRIKTLATPFSNHLISHLSTLPRPFAPPQTVAYVPLHRRRRLTRGFNQSRLLARTLSAHYHVSLDERLIRTKHTRPQMALSATERISNITGAFQIRPHSFPIEGPVVLIDDVATTLATLQECASLLKSEGASAVYACTLAA